MPNAPVRRIAWTLTLATALALLGDATLYAVLPSSYEKAGVTLVQVGWLLSVNRLVRVPLNLGSGWLSERLGGRVPFILGVGLGALSTVGYGLLRGFWPLLAMRALWGLSWTLLIVAAYSQVLESTNETERGRWTGLYASGSFFGGAIGAVLGGWMVDTLGFQPGMLILGGLTVLGFLGALTLPRRGPAPARSATGSTASLRQRLMGSWQALRGLDGRLWLILGLIMAHRFFFAGIFYATVGLYLRQALEGGLRLGHVTVGLATLTGALLLARNTLTVLVGPLLGYLSDRLRDRSLVLLLGEAAGVLSLAMLALGDQLWLAALGVALAAVAYGVVPPMLMSWLGDLTRPGERGRLVGAYQTSGDIGSGLGPLVAYAWVASLGTGPVYAICAAALACSIPLILWARRRTLRLRDGANA
jgi:MFS family permease